MSGHLRENKYDEEAKFLASLTTLLTKKDGCSNYQCVDIICGVTDTGNLVDAIHVLTSGCKSKPYILSSVSDIVNGDETNPLTYLARMERISHIQEAFMAGILGISSGDASIRNIANTCSTLGASSRTRSLLLAYLKIITKKE
jgi:hypothetical protein